MAKKTAAVLREQAKKLMEEARKQEKKEKEEQVYSLGKILLKNCDAILNSNISITVKEQVAKVVNKELKSETA